MTDREAINILWDYHHVHHSLDQADLIFILGSNDVRVAQYAAGLYLQGLAPAILFSGGLGRFTGTWAQSEAELFAAAAIEAGVPAENILIENKSTNTGENIIFSRRILAEKGYGDHLNIIAVQKPYMERRTLATLDAQWPEARVRVSSPPLSFDEYLTEQLPAAFVINAMMGDFHRILEYPKQGFASSQPVADEALAAFRHLVEAGYTSQLLQGAPLP